MAVIEQAADGVDADVSGEREERHGDQAQRGALAGPGIDPAAELPADGQRGQHLDGAVEAEPDERDGAGCQPGQDRDESLAGVVGHRGRGQPLGSAAELLPALTGELDRCAAGLTVIVTLGPSCCCRRGRGSSGHGASDAGWAGG